MCRRRRVEQRPHRPKDPDSRKCEAIVAHPGPLPRCSGRLQGGGEGRRRELQKLPVNGDPLLHALPHKRRNLLSDGKRLAGNVIVGQEGEHATCCGVMRRRRNRERKRRRKRARLESGGHETAGGEGKKAKSEQTDAPTGRPKEAGAASAFPLGRGNLREVLLLARRQLGKGRIGRGMGNGR